MPADRRECYRIAGALKPAERKAVDYVLAKFFDETPDGFRHKRCDLEIARFQDKQNKAKASAEARWSKQRTESGGNATASQNGEPDGMRTHSGRNAHQTPDTSLQSKNLNPVETPSLLNAGEAVAIMRAAGLQVGNPGHPKLVALCALGITAAELSAAVDTAKGNGKGFQYAVAVAANARNEAAGNPTTRPPSKADKLAATAANLGSARHDTGKGQTYEHA